MAKRRPEVGNPEYTAWRILDHGQSTYVTRDVEQRIHGALNLAPRVRVEEAMAPAVPVALRLVDLHSRACAGDGRRRWQPRDAQHRAAARAAQRVAHPCNV
eukprot:4279992-Prymnesium_polylepis.1